MIDLFHQGLGLIAGGIVTSAAIPRVWSIVRNISKAKEESYFRNAQLMIGNLVWVAYGNGDTLTIMCAINSVLNGIILWAAIRANRKKS